MITARILWRAMPPGLKWAALGAAVLALAFFAGWHMRGQSDALDRAENAVATHERIDDAGNDVSDNDVDERLRGLSR